MRLSVAIFGVGVHAANCQPGDGVRDQGSGFGVQGWKLKKPTAVGSSDKEQRTSVGSRKYRDLSWVPAFQQYRWTFWLNHTDVSM